MMQSKEKITRANAMEIIRCFAKEYRKTLGKAPAEIIIVGGGSIMSCSRADRQNRNKKTLPLNSRKTRERNVLCSGLFHTKKIQN